MRMKRLVLILVSVNLVLLILILAPIGTPAKNVSPVVRARVIELVDNRDQVRAQMKVEPDGEVVFRLRDARGIIRVKLGAGEDGSGLVLLDDTPAPGVHILAKRDGTSLTLADKNGQRREIKP
jgi:hypothetical protein